MKAAKRKTPALAAWECEGFRISARGSTFHATGTVRVGRIARRVRTTLGLAATKNTKGDAERELRRIIGQVRAEIGGGVTRKSVATLVAERIDSGIGPSDERILKDLTTQFTTRILWDIPPEQIVTFVEERQHKRKPETRERYLNGVCSFLNRQIAAGQYPKMPDFVRDKRARNPLRRARREVQQFRIQLLQDIIDAAHLTLAIQLRIEYVGGTRVSSVLHGCRLGDLNMETMTLTFRDTKNGDDVPTALPDSMRTDLERYLAWRQIHVRRGNVPAGSDQPLFLHYKGRPYKPNRGAWGTQNKTAFNAAKRRAMGNVATRYDDAIAAMHTAGDQHQVDRLIRLKADDLKLLQRLTQHWLRHKFATEAGRKDLRAAMAQGGWRDPRSITGYLIADAEYQRAVIEERGVPASAKNTA